MADVTLILKVPEGKNSLDYLEDLAKEYKEHAIIGVGVPNEVTLMFTEEDKPVNVIVAAALSTLWNTDLKLLKAEIKYYDEESQS